MTNAQINIDITVQSRRREEDEPFKPTSVVNTDWHRVTDLNTYQSASISISEEIYAYVLSQRSGGWENFVNISIRLNNVTAATMGAGAYPLAKGNRNAGLTGEEVVSASSIEEALNSIIVDLKQKAKY